MLKHLLRFVFENPQIPVEVSFPRTKKHPVVGARVTEWYKHKYKHYLIQWEGKHIIPRQKGKKLCKLVS